MLATLTAVCLFLVGVEAGNFQPLQPAHAQQLYVPQDTWQQLYQRIPDFPRENQYINKETGKVDSDNTLAGRLIRYHVYVKSRPPYFRLDWKLTLADYLDANERIQEATYPSASTLQTNPIEGDRAAINRLNRSQREALVDTLVSLFSPNSPSTPDQNPSTSGTSPRPTATPRPPARFQLPQPGDAQLLK